jgi:hypothetical protein
MGRKEGVSVTEEGVGGRVVVVPRERRGVGGEVGRRERMCVLGIVGCGWMYWIDVRLELESGLGRFDA